MADAPSSILARYIAQHRLDPDSRLEVVAPDAVTIIYLRALPPRHGIGGSFLHALRESGWHVHVTLPKRAALPFWQRMHDRGLVDDDPAALRTWEEYMGALERQMGCEDLARVLGVGD